MEERGNLLTLRRNGEIVAEAKLFVYDDAKALRTLLEGYQEIASLVSFELLNTVTVACHPDLSEAMGPQGIVIDLKDA